MEWVMAIIIVIAILTWFGREAAPPRPDDTPPRRDPPPPAPSRQPDRTWQAYDEGFWDGAVFGWYGARHWLGDGGDETPGPWADPDDHRDEIAFDDGDDPWADDFGEDDSW